ncbi:MULTISPECIES: AAA family ATPase [Limnospira]|uniref:ATP/GTP-binding protein n=1 Tax=Limnospira indica PCC 8005 TaxID=376219 RepID=A0A9P1KLN4_9CYAN|nr:AAA family ATPase [Limnospira indica]CDM98067.1 Putative ATP/GTP-binding protein [Limnospira indica PCC 8005]
MSIDLQRIRIERLFDAYNLDVPIQDNTLILVGENGSGKSTLINLLYYTLTTQWDRLSQLPFHSCIVTIGNQDYTIKREDLPTTQNPKRLSSLMRYFHQRLSSQEFDSLINELADHDSEYWLSKNRFLELRHKFPGISLMALRELARVSPRLASLDENEVDQVIDILAKAVQSNEREQVLFLPTYRRIEKELSDVFPDIDLDDVLPFSKTKSYRKKLQSGYVELVEFGMEDVMQAFDSTLSDLDQNFRTALNRLTGSYLGDIIRNNYKNVEPSQLSTDKFRETIKVMLPRIGDILSEGDRQKLGQLLKDVKTNQVLLEEQRVTAYFLTRLVEIHKSQQEKEQPIRNLVDLVNQYLSNKTLEFNSSEFKLVFKRKNKDMTEVPIAGLSSGEKQIISLFTHIFLSDYDKYFLVIDEPELSISVPWQRRFLQDLKDTQKCAGLIAVTHSPFVFENSLAEYAHSISEFIEEI